MKSKPIRNQDMEVCKKYKELISCYIRSKDNNKPHLMRSIFDSLASLKMEVKTDEIAFPSETIGLNAITSVLVRDFNKKFQDIYTFCFSDSLIIGEKQASCKWLVVMTDRQDESVRVGYGEYNWTFNNDLVSQLTIIIEKMVVLTQSNSQEVFTWIENQAYPWCDSSEFLKDVPLSMSFINDSLDINLNAENRQ